MSMKLISWLTSQSRCAVVCPSGDFRAHFIDVKHVIPVILYEPTCFATSLSHACIHLHASKIDHHGLSSRQSAVDLAEQYHMSSWTRNLLPRRQRPCKARVHEVWVKALIYEAVKMLFSKGRDGLYHMDKADVGTRDERYKDATAWHAHDMIIKWARARGWAWSSHKLRWGWCAISEFWDSVPGIYHESSLSAVICPVLFSLSPVRTSCIFLFVWHIQSSKIPWFTMYFTMYCFCISHVLCWSTMRMFFACLWFSF